MFCHKDYIKTMCHLNEAGTYYTKLINSLITIKHLVLTQQVKLAEHMALSFLSAMDADLSAGQQSHFHLFILFKKNMGLSFCLQEGIWYIQPSSTFTFTPAWWIFLSIITPLNDGGWQKWPVEQNNFPVRQNLKALGSCCLFPTMVRQLVDTVTGWNRNQGGMWMSLTAPTWAACQYKTIKN